MRVVLQVRVLNDHEVAGSFLDTATERRSFAQITRLLKHPQLSMLTLQLRQNLRGAIARAVVYADQLKIHRCN